MEQSVSNAVYYAFYAAILVVFIVVLKLPKKKNAQGDKKTFVSTSKKFNQNTESQNDTKDI